MTGIANDTRSVLGDQKSYVEGVILRIKSNGDIFEVKGTSENFSKFKDLLWGDRVKILALESEFESKIMSQVLKLKTTYPAHLNSIIAKTSEEFESKETDPENKKIEFLKFLIPNLTSGKIDFDLSKSYLSSVLKECENKYQDILQNFKINNKFLDFDSIRKTNEFFKAFKNKFEFYNDLLNNQNLNGLDFYLKIFSYLLDFRINKNIDFSYYTDPEEQKRPKIIIWNRASPTLAFGS